MGSIREITREQFADGTTIDAGTRIERALADLVQRFNALLPRDRKRRWFPATYTGGYMPTIRAGAQGNAPWLSAANVAGLTVVNVPFGGIQNEWRNKGIRNVLIDPDNGNGDQLVWTTALYFGKPVIVTGLSLFLGSDESYYFNTFRYQAGAPAPKTSLPGDDVVVELAVDHPWNGHAPLAGAQEFLRTQFKLNAHAFAPVAPAAFADGTPGFAINAAYAAAKKYPNGVMLWQPDLNIALPDKSTARLSFTIPEYSNPAWANWSGSPWQAQYYSWALHVLEAAE